MKIATPFSSSGDIGNSKASSPIAEEICEAGCFVVLIGAQLGICNDIGRHKEEAIPKALERSCKRIVFVIGCKIKRAVVPHRRGNGYEADDGEIARRRYLTLNELRTDGRKQCDHE